MTEPAIDDTGVLGPIDDWIDNHIGGVDQALDDWLTRRPPAPPAA